MRPRIGITTWLRALPTYLGRETQLYTLGSEYVVHVLAAGGLPLLLPHAGDAKEVLDLLDGLLLSGGDDLHPESYGERHDGTSTSVRRDADDWEIALVRAAAARRLPTLGICRGMQVMAVAFGGRLIQNLEDVEGHPHLEGMEPEAILALRHRVSLEPACTIAAIYGETERFVNTIHHQALVEAGALRVVGYGSGAVIEAIEAGNNWPALGVQWHPEKMPEPQEYHLFEYFIAASKQYAKDKSIVT
jgi:putative glutamine amidotransferase